MTVTTDSVALPVALKNQDDEPIDPATIWLQKGCASAGSVDIARRLRRHLLAPCLRGLR